MVLLFLVFVWVFDLQILINFPEMDGISGLRHREFSIGFGSFLSFGLWGVQPSLRVVFIQIICIVLWCLYVSQIAAKF
jgi:hypothetical protein